LAADHRRHQLRLAVAVLRKGTLLQHMLLPLLAQRYTAAVDFAALDRARFILDRTHAFADPNEADAAGIRLILPTPEILANATRH
jgi:hypothetical protein